MTTAWTGSYRSPNSKISALVDSYWNEPKLKWMAATTKLKTQGLRQERFLSPVEQPATGKATTDQTTPTIQTLDHPNETKQTIKEEEMKHASSSTYIQQQQQQQHSTRIPVVPILKNNTKWNQTLFDRSSDSLEPVLQDEGLGDYMKMNPFKKEVRRWFNIQQEAQWSASQIRMYNQDRKTYQEMDALHKQALDVIASFFAAIDQLVGESVDSLGARVSHTIKEFYGLQSYIEIVHNQFYNQYAFQIFDPETYESKLKALQSMQVVQDKVAWVKRWAQPGLAFRFQVAQQLITEGLFFYGAFAFVFYLKNAKFKLPAFIEGNSYVAKDEALHVDFAIFILANLNHTLEEDIFREMVESALQVEDAFWEAILKDFHTSRGVMNVSNMKHYLRYTANILAERLHFKPFYPDHRKSPFAFIRENEVISKNNFFEANGVDYPSRAVLV